MSYLAQASTHVQLEMGKCVLELFEQLETHEVVAASKVKNSQELIETL